MRDLPELFPLGVLSEEVAVMAFLTGYQGRPTIAGITGCTSPDDARFDVGMRSLLSKGLVHVAEGETSVARLVTDVSRCLAAPDSTGLVLFASDGDGEAFSFASSGEDLLLLQHVADGVLSCWVGPTQLFAVVMAIAGGLSAERGEVSLRIDPLLGEALELAYTDGRWHELDDADAVLEEHEVEHRIAGLQRAASPAAGAQAVPGVDGPL